MKKIGLVLSGGGARGFAHLGVLKLLEELNLQPYSIAGASAGAIVGALYAAGIPADEIHSRMKKNSYFGWSNIAWRKKGFFTMDALHNLLKSNIDKNDFNFLQTRLYIAATDLAKGKSVIFSKGNLFETVIASASIPIVFEPVRLDEMLLVDGGVTNNFPLEPLTKHCNIIIGSHVNKLDDNIGNSVELKNAGMIDRCFHLAISNSVYSKVNKCDLFIDSPLQRYSMFDVKQADKIFKIGYDTAKEFTEKLSGLLA